MVPGFLRAVLSPLLILAGAELNNLFIIMAGIFFTIMFTAPAIWEPGQTEAKTQQDQKS